MSEGRTEVPENEFYTTVAKWLGQVGHRDVKRVYLVQEITKQLGGCETCWEEVKYLRIGYYDNSRLYGRMITVDKRVAYADFIRDLEKIAYNEERRQPRMRMHADLRTAIKTMPGRGEMVFKTLTKLRYKDADGVEHRVEPDTILTYLPPTSVEWLVKEGHVQPLCTSETSEDCSCDWCQLSVLTEQDQEWLGLYGWKNPFSS